MAKDKSLSKEERKAAKKAAKTETSLTESAGVSKSKSEKKEKKDKKEKKAKLAAQLLDEVEKADGAVVEVKGNKKVVVSNVGADGEVVSDEDEGMVVDSKGAVRPIGALVPFANPLADEKVAKKVFRGVKKGTLLCLSCLVLYLSGYANIFSSSCCSTNPQTRSQRSRQVSTKVYSCRRRECTSRHCRTRSRHLANGCDQPHSSIVRRPPHPLYLRYKSRGTWYGRPNEKTYVGRHDCKRRDTEKRSGEESGGW